MRESYGGGRRGRGRGGGGIWGYSGLDSGGGAGRGRGRGRGVESVMVRVKRGKAILRDVGKDREKGNAY